MVPARTYPIVAAMLKTATEPALVRALLPTTQGGRHAMVTLQATLTTIAPARLAPRAG
jgi:hypothetical protein